MTSLYPQPAVVMTTDECWARLSSMSLGRLVTVAGGEPEIVPVNFAVQRRTVIIRTGPGTKLRDVQTNPRVLFEVDDHTFETGGVSWSGGRRRCSPTPTRSPVPNVPRCCRG